MNQFAVRIDRAEKSSPSNGTSDLILFNTSALMKTTPPSRYRAPKRGRHAALHHKSGFDLEN
jgi:hypothetical protein